MKPLSPYYPKILKTLGNHLKKRRLDLGLRQKDIALQLGVNVSSVINWETDRTKPTICFTPRILEFLGYDPYPSGQTIGEQLVTARRQLGLSQDSLARCLGIDRCTLSNWEIGKREPKGKWLRMVRDFLSTGLECMQFGDGSASPRI